MYINYSPGPCCTCHRHRGTRAPPKPPKACDNKGVPLTAIEGSQKPHFFKQKCSVLYGATCLRLFLLHCTCSLGLKRATENEIRIPAMFCSNSYIFESQRHREREKGERRKILRAHRFPSQTKQKRAAQEQRVSPVCIEGSAQALCCSKLIWGCRTGPLSSTPPLQLIPGHRSSLFRSLYHGACEPLSFWDDLTETRHT